LLLQQCQQLLLVRLRTMSRESRHKAMLPMQNLLLHQLSPLLLIIEVSSRAAAAEEQTAAVRHLLLRVYHSLLLLLLLLLLLECGSVPDERPKGRYTSAGSD
jgi:hypothetical protein